MKLVLDSDVIVAAIRSSRGASAELLRQARQGRFRLVVSVPLVLEYEAVATRPEHLAAGEISHEEAQILIDAIVGLSEWTRVYYLYRPMLRDPADEMVLEAALNSGADAVVTFNLRDYGTAPAAFNLGCWLPRDALEKIR